MCVSMPEPSGGPPSPVSYRSRLFRPLSSLRGERLPATVPLMPETAGSAVKPDPTLPPAALRAPAAPAAAAAAAAPIPAPPPAAAVVEGIEEPEGGWIARMSLVSPVNEWICVRSLGLLILIPRALHESAGIREHVFEV